MARKKPSSSVTETTLARSTPSTSTLILPSGSFRLCTMLTMRADVVDFVGLGFVDGGVVLGGEKDLLVARHGLFQRPHARFAAHHERGHHVRKDDHVADGHHRQTFCIGFFL